MPETYAPPVQRKPLNVEDPSPLKAFVNMSDPDARLHFVKDISPTLEGGVWRWARQNPTLMLSVPDTKGWKFSADFAVPELSLRSTGPVTITITINGHELDKTRYEKAGDQHVEKPVPPEWLRANAENLVAFNVDKVYIAEIDKAVLGFVLTRAGFRR